MVAIKNVADMPVIANAGAGMDRIAVLVKRVPVQKWRMVLMAIALFWIVHSLAKAIWYVVPSPKLDTPKVVPTLAAAKAPSSAGSGKQVDLNAALAAHIMGEFNAEVGLVDNGPVEPQETVELTKLNLKLLGIVASSEKNGSWAIIGPSPDNQKIYKIGDEVEGVRGVKIAEVFDLKVRLNNNGNLEDLWLYGEDGKSVAKSNYTPPPVSRPDDGVKKATVRRDQIQEARNIGDVVRFMVATENGKMIGYKVRPGRKRELFDQVGLKTDDIVVSVNGIEVNEPQKVREVYQALKNATEANLQIMRDGTTHSIQISMSSEG